MKKHLRTSTMVTALIMTANAALHRAAAFVVPSVELPPGTYKDLNSGKYRVATESETLSRDVDKVSPIATEGSWRVALNLGREFGTPLWDTFGISGIRFPVVVPLDFFENGNLVEPQRDTVSYVADVNGGVTKPVEGGTWKVDKKKETLEFTIRFPEELMKKDVKIPAGSDLVLEGRLVSTKEMKRFQDAFQEARKEEWKAQEKIDEIQAIRDSPKRWNEEKQRWEHRTIDEPLTSLFSKQLDYFVKGQNRRQKFAEKPRSGVELSKRPGRFPRYKKDDLVYFGTQGVIRNKSRGNMVVGTWTAEPIDGQPASYLS